MSVVMPALFVGHGSPLNAIQQNEFTQSLKKLGPTLPRPKAILVISAHWETSGTRVTGGEQIEQIFDFSGFPAQLSRLRYRPPGAPIIARHIADMFTQVEVLPVSSWGLDHGAWSVLCHLYPEADIPVLELSLDADLPLFRHLEIGQMLEPLRSEGILVISSGNMVHNLADISMDQYTGRPYDWAFECDSRISACLNSRDNDALSRFGDLDRSLVKRLAPTLEHYLPLLYIAGLRTARERLTYIHQGFQHGSISMRSFLIGD